MIGERLDSERVYNTQVIVSPMRLAGESKDQDRAGWHAPTATACVADGVTDSPLSDCAAELAVQFSPLLFGGPPRPRLEILAELLFALRAQARRSHVALPPDTLPAMREVLMRAAQAKLAHAYQTTLVAARFTPGGAAVGVEVIRCGDSSFFAFGPDGTLLAHTFPNAAGAGTFGFGPGDTLVARVLGTVAELPLLLPAGTLDRRNPHNWLVCVAVEVPVASRAAAEALWLRSGDLLLVPHYLARQSRDPQFDRYCRVLYSPPDSVAVIASNTGPARVLRWARQCHGTTPR